MEAIKSAFLFITLSFLFCCIEANSFGFSTNLIHRDSMLSPYFNSSRTYYENIRNSILRAKDRSAYLFSRKLDSSPSTILSPLTATFAEYLMKISVGTPPLDLLAVADTGSDLAWTQCEPCSSCYVQETPLFNPQNSSTYQNQSCQSDACRSLPDTSCNDDNNCNYDVSYGDGSYSRGDLSSESFTFESTSGSPVTLPNISFGCGHSNGGLFDNYTSGIVGLGNGELSIVNQLSHTIDGKFSYCLAPLMSQVMSRISFGSDAVVSGDGVQTTPFYTKDTDTYYNLNLESFTVGNINVKFVTNKNTNEAVVEDNIIIDSGTTLTYFPSIIYPYFENQFKSRISSTPIEGRGGCHLCYNKEEGFEQKVPIIRFHFTGAVLDLDATNTLIEVEEGVVCLAIVPATDDDVGGIFGNVMQRNYLVGYDLVSKTVSFKKSDCTDL